MKEPKQPSFDYQDNPEDLEYYRKNSKYAPFMREDPFSLDPSLGYQIGVSGGRTSAYLLRLVLDRNGGLPDNARAIFTNTGKEREETLEFVKEIEERWNVPILWLEYWRDETRRGTKNDPRNIYRVVDFKTASRKGEPFEMALETRKTVPGTGQRFCTSMLKIFPADRYLRHELGWKTKNIRKMLGIRRDEESRATIAFLSECPVELPLLSAGIGADEINRFWAESPFDLALKSGMGNCDLCFMKSVNLSKGILQKEPERADQWIEWEKKYGLRMEKHGQFSIPVLRQHRFRRDMTMEELLTTTLNSDEEFSEEYPAEDGLGCYCGDD